MAVGAPAIDYLARDYQALRRLLLDRMSLAMPGWSERNPADLGVVLVELLAHVADQLSYRQDAVATEAYLATARRRISVRRHARLVDYRMHDGCNARAWVQVRLGEAAAGPVALPRGTRFLTSLPDTPGRIEPGSRAYRDALGAGAEVFESMHDATLHPAHWRMAFHTWGERRCCLPRGAVRATLKGRFETLEPGMVLVFQELRSPRTGEPGDADPGHRHAVRLTEVVNRDPLTGVALADPVGGRFDARPHGDPVPVTEIGWDGADALPFPLCLSAETEDGRAVEGVSVALGNIVLADHGRSRDPEPLLPVPAPRPGRRLADAGPCAPREGAARPPRYRPLLAEGPVTQAAPFDPGRPPASAHQAMHWDAADAAPQVWLSGTAPGGLPLPWSARRDLLNSGAKAEFVVEIENDGGARLRFGDGTHGMRPAAGTRFSAGYRTGNGSRGNLGAESLRHLVSGDSAIADAINPLPARGGVEPESIDRVRERAPWAFRSQRRAVTPADYAARAATFPGVQKAAASLRWTGSWHTLSVNLDRSGGQPLDDAFEAGMLAHLEPYRLAGHDLEIDRPRMVPLELAMTVQVLSGYERSQVRAGLLDLFGNRDLPDGRRGLFHPDNFSFGQTVYLSPLYAAAQALDGVEAVEVTRFQRQDGPGPEGIDEGRLAMQRFEIPRLDNDPNFPGRGVLRLTLRGGR
jgi:hypothetical protein